MRSYNRLDVDRLHETATEKTLRAEIERSAKRARNRTSDRALPRFTREHEGRRRIVEEPPLITHVLGAEDATLIAAALDEYLDDAGTALAPGRWAATPWSTSPTRSSGSAASACAPTSRCSRAAVPTTWCSCS